MITTMVLVNTPSCHMIIISFSVVKTLNSIFIIIYLFGGFPGGSVVKNPLVKQETWVQSLNPDNPLGKEIATHSIILAWEIP